MSAPEELYFVSDAGCSNVGVFVNHDVSRIYTARLASMEIPYARLMCGAVPGAAGSVGYWIVQKTNGESSKCSRDGQPNFLKPLDMDAAARTFPRDVPFTGFLLSRDTQASMMLIRNDVLKSVPAVVQNADRAVVDDTAASIEVLMQVDDLDAMRAAKTPMPTDPDPVVRFDVSGFKACDNSNKVWINRSTMQILKAYGHTNASEDNRLLVTNLESREMGEFFRCGNLVWSFGSRMSVLLTVIQAEAPSTGNCVLNIVSGEPKLTLYMGPDVCVQLPAEGSTFEVFDGPDGSVDMRFRDTGATIQYFPLQKVHQSGTRTGWHPVIAGGDTLERVLEDMESGNVLSAMGRLNEKDCLGFVNGNGDLVTFSNYGKVMLRTFLVESDTAKVLGCLNVVEAGDASSSNRRKFEVHTCEQYKQSVFAHGDNQLSCVAALCEVAEYVYLDSVPLLHSQLSMLKWREMTAWPLHRLAMCCDDKFSNSPLYIVGVPRNDGKSFVVFQHSPRANYTPVYESKRSADAVTGTASFTVNVQMGSLKHKNLIVRPDPDCPDTHVLVDDLVCGHYYKHRHSVNTVFGDLLAERGAVTLE